MSLSEVVFATDEELQEVEAARIAFEKDMFMFINEDEVVDASTHITNNKQDDTTDYEEPCGR